VHLLSSSHPRLTMSSDNCAVGPDGELLDESEIPWVYDPDDDRPMPPATTSSTDQRQLSATTLDSFITQVPPAACRSTCTSHPSTKVTDPDNVMARKRKPSDSASTNPPRRARQASPEHEEDNATEPEPTDTEDVQDNDPVNPEIAYEETKALGDADRKVCVQCSSQVLSLFDTLQRPCTRSPRKTAQPTSEHFS